MANAAVMCLRKLRTQWLWQPTGAKPLSAPAASESQAAGGANEHPSDGKTLESKDRTQPGDRNATKPNAWLPVEDLATGKVLELFLFDWEFAAQR